MKKTNLILLTAMITLPALGQPSLKAVLKRNVLGHKRGDTVEIVGHLPAFGGEKERFIVARGEDKRYLYYNEIVPVGEIVDFWDKYWFYYRSGEVLQKRRNEALLDQLRAENKAFVRDMNDRDLLFSDALVVDYLYQLVHKIHPLALHKDYRTNFTIAILKANDENAFSFDDGTIFLTTKLLAKTSQEKDLVRILAQQIARIELDFQLQNLQQQYRANRSVAFWTGVTGLAGTIAALGNEANGRDDFTMDDAITLTAAANLISQGVAASMGVQLDKEQTERANQIANFYMSGNYLPENQLSRSDYLRNISSVITYTAWQDYYQSAYNESLGLVNKLENDGVASNEDFLLKAKLYRTLYATEESDYEALRYLKMAKNMGSAKLVDIFKEEGLLYLRVHDDNKAKDAFMEYRKGLEELHDRGVNNEDEIRWVNNLMQKYRML